MCGCGWVGVVWWGRFGEYGVDDGFFKGWLYNVVKDGRGVGEGDWGKLLSHLLREMWIEMVNRLE